jgi:methionyl-tRNA formyltransferase
MSFKILFMGTPDFAVPILEALQNSDNKILEIYTQPAKKKDRGQKIQNSPVHDCAKKHNLQVRCPISLANSEELNHLKTLKPDAVVVVAYGQILPSDFLNLKNTIFLNVHASLLPKWRGAAPIQRAIMNMDKETGISIMKIVEKLDAGPVLLKSKIKIDKESNYQDISKKMSTLGAKLILDALDLIKSGNVNFSDQNENEATYAKKIDKRESKINWKDNASNIVAKINALNPSPGCWFNLLGSRIKIIKAREVNIKGQPGVVLNEDLTIACSTNAIQVLELQKEGKKKTSVQEFLRGNKLKTGITLI